MAKINIFKMGMNYKNRFGDTLYVTFVCLLKSAKMFSAPPPCRLLNEKFARQNTRRVRIMSTVTRLRDKPTD